MDLGAIPNASTTKFGGDQLSTFAKGNVFTRLRNCRSASQASVQTSKRKR